MANTKQIVDRWSGKVLWEGEAETIREALEKANLVGANLVGANLVGANLVGANLDGANLVRANLVRANLVGANLVGANLVGANLDGANLDGANLVGANLDGANLVGANLDGAKMSPETRIWTGETWHDYLTKVVPALLTAGGKAIESFTEHFDCHTWENCPMAHAFSGHDLSSVPILLRPRASQFIQFFDSKLIPWPLPSADAAEGKA